MKLKQKPEDFTVTESWRFDKVPSGEYRVYAMDKQKVSTFDAIGRIADLFGMPPSVFSFCGLKDKQGRTRQLIAVRGSDVDFQDEDLRLKYLGRTDRPLSAANTTSNRFGVTVRDLADDEVARLPPAVAEVNRLGVVNYFDSQRFGSLKHGQGFIAKELIRGDFEMALKNYLAKPSDLDRTYDAKVKAFWRDHWGEWRRRCTIPGAERYERIIEVLRRRPQDFRGAFLRIDPKQRAMLIFTYQSWLWNESVRRYLVSLLHGQSLIAVPYQAGKLLFPRDAPPEVLRKLRDQTMPLLAPETELTDPEVRSAVEWVLGREKLTLDKLSVPETPEIFFRHEDRPVLVYPGALMLGPPRRDELNDGRKKIYVAFTLPPGSYATLVTRRLFHYTTENDDWEIENLPQPEQVGEQATERPGNGRRRTPGGKPSRAPRHEAASEGGDEAPRLPPKDRPARAPRRAPIGAPGVAAGGEQGRVRPRRGPKPGYDVLQKKRGPEPLTRRERRLAQFGPPASQPPEDAPALAKSDSNPSASAADEGTGPRGFRAHQKAKKQQKTEARASATVKSAGRAGAAKSKSGKTEARASAAVKSAGRAGVAESKSGRSKPRGSRDG